IQLKIKQQVYDKHIASGKSLAASDRLDQALTEYQNATKIQQQYGVKPNAQLPTLLKGIAKTINMRKLSMLKSQLPTMRLSEAKTQFQMINVDLNTYEITNDNDIKKITNELNQKLGNKECQEANEKIAEHINTAKDFEAKLKYTEAQSSYIKAINVALSLASCGIDTQSISKQKSRIAVCVQFETMLIDANNMVAKTDYNKAIEMLNNASNFQKNQKLDAFNIPALNLEEWTINNASDNFFKFQMADHLYRAKDYLGSLRVLKSSFVGGSRKMDYKLTKDLQENLGKAIANLDHRSKGNTPKIWVMTYMTGNEKELKYFKKAYLKQWKVLEKNK
ncbi:MAG: hypothetical protein HYZ42_15890, partial [Bacteroidetes bacterium]|nr:hypothetical protein [Bacteroidota bacterium]